MNYMKTLRRTIKRLSKKVTLKRRPRRGGMPPKKAPAKPSSGSKPPPKLPPRSRKNWDAR